jgi:hypothetical protein
MERVWSEMKWTRREEEGEVEGKEEMRVVR